MAYQKVWEEALRIALLMAGLKGQLMLTRRKVYHKKGRQKDLLMVIQMDRNFEGSLVFFSFSVLRFLQDFVALSFL